MYQWGFTVILVKVLVINFKGADTVPISCCSNYLIALQACLTIKPYAKGDFHPSAVSNQTDHKPSLSWHSLHCFQQQSCFTLTVLRPMQIYPQEGDDLLCQHPPFLLGLHIPNPAARPVPKEVMENFPTSSLGQLQAGWARKAFNTQRNQHLPGETAARFQRPLHDHTWEREGYVGGLVCVHN